MEADTSGFKLDANGRINHAVVLTMDPTRVQYARSLSLASEDTLTINSSPKAVNKHGIYARAIIFIFFESSFITFAYYCLFHPIPLQSYPDQRLDVFPSLNITDTEFKAGITAMSVAWHALACLLIGDIISVVRSAEFMAQYHRLGEDHRRISDKVSTLTGGLIDSVVHFVTGSSTRHFRVAIGAMCIAMMVGPLGSSTITIGTMTRTMWEPIQITNTTQQLVTSAYAAGRIPLIMRIEKEEDILYEYDMTSSSSPDATLIPWPHFDFDMPEGSILVYRSDIIQYRFECSWIPLSAAEYLIQRLPLQLVHDRTDGLNPQFSYQPYGIYPSIDSKSTPNAVIVFITDPSQTSYASISNLTLSGVPHAFPLTWGNVTQIVGNQSYHSPTLMAAILRCHPNSRIVPAVITLAQKTLTARTLPVSMGHSALIGNIGVAGTGLILDSLYTAIMGYHLGADKMFLKARRIIPLGSEAFQTEQEPFSVEDIAANLDVYMQSIGKVYVCGIDRNNDYSSSTTRTFNQTVEIRVPIAAVASNEAFLIGFTVVIGLIIILVGVLVWTIREIDLRLFNLENLVEILGPQHWT